MTTYNRPFLTIDKQIELFKKRGLKIEDKKRAEFFLKHISYYHLSIYTKSLQNKNNSFKDGSNFEDVIALYNFDKKLRLLLLDVLERIEMSFKCVLAYKITKHEGDNFWYTNEKNFCNGKDDIIKLLEGIKESKDIYIEHYYESYSEPVYPPAWIFFESLTFGNCSRLAKNLYDNERHVLAGFYKLSKKTVIQMLHSLSHLRNVCAHHSRVWNRNFTFSVIKHKKYEHVFENSSTTLYAYLVVAQIFVSKISPSSKWLNKLDDLISEYDVDIYRMGFPEDWKSKLESVK